MTFNLNPADLPITKNIALRLILIIVSFASLTYSGRRGYLRPKETLWVGAAIVFCAVGWLLPEVAVAVRSRFADPTQALLISTGMVLPIVIALIVGLWMLYRGISKPKG